MRWLKFVYEQYIKDIQEKIENYEPKMTKLSKITDKERKMFEKFKEKLKKSETLFLSSYRKPKEGEIYLYKNIYFVIAETKRYPYEVYICSPFWELATEKDIIVKGEDTDWVIENIVRYVTDEVVMKAFLIDKVFESEVKIMWKYIHEGIELPKEKIGIKAELNTSYQALFKKKERERSLMLLPIIEGEEDIKETDTVTAPFFSKEELPLAADSFEEFDTMDHINLIKDKDKVILEFDEEYAGSLAEVLLKDKKIFEGFLPKQLEIKTDLYPAQIKELLNIKFL